MKLEGFLNYGRGLSTPSIYSICLNLFCPKATFELPLPRIVQGKWRELTRAGIQGVKDSLLSSSLSPLEDQDNIVNLQTGIKADEYILVFPQSWEKFCMY